MPAGLLTEARAERLDRAKPVMAKASLNSADAWMEQVGAALQRAISLRGWSLKEFSGAVGRDERQCSRWIKGKERAQFDVLFSVEELRQPLVIALAELAGQAVEVETTIRVRRTA